MAEFLKVEGKDFGNIRLYTLSTCIWCRKTKAFLNSHNVAYSYVDVDRLSPEEQEIISGEQRQYNPSESFPTIIVGDDLYIIGYDEEKLKELVGE